MAEQDAGPAAATHPVAARVMAAVRGLGVKYGFEPSFKLRRGELLEERFLLGLRKQRIAGDCDAALLRVCESLGMPEALLSPYREHLRSSNYVHFGFERTRDGALAKAYLEFFEHVQAQVQAGRDRAGPHRMHLGFKWMDARDARPVVTEYHWYPSLPLAQMETRAHASLGDAAAGASGAFLSAVLREAVRRVGYENLFYLEVTEPDTQRRSFDINLYRARLTMAGLREWTLPLSAHYAVPEAALQQHFALAGDRPLGHVAGGVDRQGREFLTVYFGVQYFEPGARPATYLRVS